MSKQSKIKNLLVVPLIASAVLLANPVFADNHIHPGYSLIRHKTEGAPNTKRGVVGVVTSINGNIIVVTTKDGTEYTVDAGNATIMKASDTPNSNPEIVTISDIKVGDAIVVRGTINNTEVNAEKIFDGKFPHRHHKHSRHHS